MSGPGAAGAGSSFERLVSIYRAREWHDTKIPLLLTAFYVLARTSELPGREILFDFVAVLIFSAGYLAFSYAFNNYCDEADDVRAGKTNPFTECSPLLKVGLLVLPLAISLLAACRLVATPWQLGWLLTNYLLAIAYSMPPLRLKVRDWIGLLVSSTAQRVTPVLILFGRYDGHRLDVLLLLALFGLVGLRWILIHQVLDAGNDRVAGLCTFATRRGAGASDRLLWRLVFPLELLVLLAFLGCLGEAGLRAGLAFLVYVAYWLERSVWEGLPLARTSYSRPPLEGWYMAVLPLLASFELAQERGLFWPLFLLQAGVASARLARRWRERSAARRTHGGV